MLSNEEKAVLKTAKENYGLTSAEQKILVNLIEKQSKEIEELKNADLTIVYLNGVYDGVKKVEDKIKARIEELDETRQYWTEEVKVILQALLLKE